MYMSNIELYDIKGGCKALRKVIKIIAHALIKAYRVLR